MKRSTESIAIIIRELAEREVSLDSIQTLSSSLAPESKRFSGVEELLNHSGLDPLFHYIYPPSILV